MGEYSNKNELYHYGVLGMKWGVRRFQNKDGTLTSAGKKKYNPNKSDEKMFGKKGAQRIADRRNRGDSRPKALRKEFVRDGSIAGVAITGATAISYFVSSGKAGKVARKVVSAGKKVVDSYYNTDIVDSRGNVLARYHDLATVGEQLVNSLIMKK